MKKKLYTTIGLMSGTSMDGIDLSIISSDGYDEFSNILDDYYEYDKNFKVELVRLRDLVLTKNDLLVNSKKWTSTNSFAWWRNYKNWRSIWQRQNKKNIKRRRD